MYYPPNQPRAKNPGERIATRDTVGKLKYLHRTTWRNTVTNKDAPRMVLYCDPDLGGCGSQMEWSSQELARRRRRWARLGMTPQCPTCEDREKHPRRYQPAWKGIPDMVALDSVRRLWKSIVYDRVRVDRMMKGNRRLQAFLYGSGFCDALQFHIDRKWTSAFEGNPDPFETFLHEMGMPPEGKPYLLRRDPMAPMCRANCYWGSSQDRRTNRSDNLTAMHALGTRMVMLPDLFGDGVDVVVTYAVVQGSRYDPRAANAGPKARFV